MAGNQEPDGPGRGARLTLVITLTIAILGAVFMVASMFWLKQQAAEHGSAPLSPVVSGVLVQPA